MDDRMIIYADDLYHGILEELPDNRGEAYYALSMVLEMIEHMKQPLPTEPHACREEMYDDCDCCTDMEVEHHFDITIEAEGVEDLRDQLAAVYEYTYSEEFQNSLTAYDEFEYDSESNITHAFSRGDTH